MWRALARTNTSLWWIACLFVCAFYLVTVPRLWQCEGVDEIEYLSVAHSMFRGDGYTLDDRPFVYYPPLYSFLLSRLMRFGVTAWPLMYLVNAALGCAALILVAASLRRMGPAGRLASWLSIFSYYAWSFSTRYLMSDPLFTLCTAVALVMSAELLREDGVTKGPGILLVLFSAVLAAMTRSSSIALAGALVMAGLFAWVKARNRAGLWVVVAGLLAALFIGYWEVRAVVVDPNAPESNARWALKMLGLSRETTGYVATSIGTGTTHATTYPERVIMCAIKTGQYITSMVRRPSNAEPLALLLFALFFTGVLKGLPHSPFAWYALLSTGMICLTPWYTDYLRYLYALTPMLFYFAAEGAAAWWGCVDRSRRRILASGLGAWAIAALGYSWVRWPFGVGDGRERLYTTWIGIMILLVYVIALITAVLLWKRDAKPVWSVAVLATIIVAFFAQSFMVAAARTSLTRRNTMLNERNMTGCVEAGRWLQEKSPANAVCYSSVPRLVSFLANRPSRYPSYAGDGRLEIRDPDYVLLAGDLRDIPFFRPAEEERLKAAVLGSRLTLAFAFGEAEVYKLDREE